MKNALLILTLCSGMAAAGQFAPYPGAMQNPEPKRNPDHVISYSTADAYAKVVDFYRKGNKVDESIPGTAQIHFDGGDGILVRDLKPQGTVIVYDPKKR